MSVFNSLGSNYLFSDALRILFAWGGTKSHARLVDFLARRYGGAVTLTYKGREAIRLALANIAKPGSTVVINGFTCYAVYQAIVQSGYVVQCLDVESGSLNFSPALLEAAVEKNPDIQVVIIQNTLGEPCQAREIADFCRSKNLVLIEDLAHSIGVHYASGEEAGTIGDFTILSFSQDKVIDAVSGGALVTRQNTEISSAVSPTKSVDRSQQVRDRFYPLITFLIRRTYASGIGKLLHAVCRSLHLLSRPISPGSPGEIHDLPNWYTKVTLHEYLRLAELSAHRQAITNVYTATIEKELFEPFVSKQATSAIYLRFPILIEQREKLITYLRQREIHISDVWYDAPIAPKKYVHLTSYAGECPRAEKIAEHILNLPTHRTITPVQARHIAHEVNAWFTSQC